MRADVIVTGTDAAIAAVERQTRSIPIVMVAASDPVGTGFVASLARPGGNVTGSSRMSSELGAKRLELLREAVPQLSRVAVVTPNPVTFANQDQVPGFARRQRRPSIYGVHEYVDAGGLMAYGASIGAAYRRAAFFVDRILKGARPGDVPVEQPTTFELVINLKTAKAIGLAIPPPLLRRADRVIE